MSEDASKAKCHPWRSQIWAEVKQAGFDPDLGKQTTAEVLADKYGIKVLGTVCPKCGSYMVHTRLKGYVCHACH